MITGKHIIKLPGQKSGRDTNGEVTHFVSAMGTTGTIMGVSTLFKRTKQEYYIVGAQPEDGAKFLELENGP